MSHVPLRFITHCAVGALCSPPSNPDGTTVYVTFPAPNDSIARLAVPFVPGSVESSNLDSRAQHSRMEMPSFALMAVMFSVLGLFGDESVSAVACVCSNSRTGSRPTTNCFIFNQILKSISRYGT